MLKSLMLMDRKRMMHYTELVDYLKSNPLEAELLGFNRNGGTVEVPSVKTFWHFHRLRMGKQWDSLFEMLRDEVIAQGRVHLKDYHLRSRKEGHHGYWKEHLSLQRRLRVRGLRNVDIFLTRNLCTILAVALNRLQHGVREHLSSVAYLK